MSVLACCRTNQIAQVDKLRYVITNSQLANFLAPKQMLLVADNLINTYNYPIYWPLYVNLPQFSQESVQTLFFDGPQDARKKFGLGTRLILHKFLRR